MAMAELTHPADLGFLAVPMLVPRPPQHQPPSMPLIPAAAVAAVNPAVLPKNPASLDTAMVSAVTAAMAAL